MKRILFFVMIVSITTSLFAQTRYNDGFKNGYKEGYCHDKGVGCIPPNPPIAPTPQIGEDFNSYQDGYNRGFKMGTQANTSSNQTSGRQQYLDHDKPQFVDDFIYKGPTYSQREIEAMDRTARNRAQNQNICDRNQQYYDEINEQYSKCSKFPLVNGLFDSNGNFGGEAYQLALSIETRMKDMNDSPCAAPSLYKALQQLDSDVKRCIELLSNPIPRGERAFNYLGKEKYEEAIKACNEAIQLASNYAPAYLIRGMAYLKTDEVNSAMKDFSKYIQLEPQNPNGYYYRGVVYFSQGNYTEAISDFSKYFIFGGNEPSGYYYRGWAKYWKKDYLEALTDFNKLIELAPTAEAYLYRGLVKSELKDYYGSIKDNDEAIKLNPNYSIAYNNRGWAKFELKKYNEALVDVNKAIELDDKYATAYDSRAEIKFNLNDYKGCIDDCDKALSINPNISNTYFLKGRAIYRLGNKEKACEYWSKAGDVGEADTHGKKEAFEYIAKYCNK